MCVRRTIEEELVNARRQNLRSLERPAKLRPEVCGAEGTQSSGSARRRYQLLGPVRPPRAYCKHARARSYRRLR